MGDGDYIRPKLGATHFHCPHCGRDATHQWFDLWAARGAHRSAIQGFASSTCDVCGRHALWSGEQLIHPAEALPRRHTSPLPDALQPEYAEACRVFVASPAACAALLRVALVKLCRHLGCPGQTLAAARAHLQAQACQPVALGLFDLACQRDGVWLEPGRIDLRDRASTACALFELIDLLV